jgi:cytochrome c oxidase assembly factor CtaG/putative copper export protein
VSRRTGVNADPVDGTGDVAPHESMLRTQVVVAGQWWRHRLGWAPAAFTAAVVALVTALLLGGGRPQRALDGLPDAGLVTGWALPLARVAFDVAAIGTIGWLLVAAVLVDRFDLPEGRLSPLAVSAVRTASLWAAGWCAATLSVLVLSLSNVVGVPVGKLLSPPVLASLPWAVPMSTSLIVTVVACLALVGFARRTVTRKAAGALLVLAVAALVPVLFTGHAAATADHDLATSSLVVHVVAASLWVGGLVALLVCVRADERVLATALPRFSNLALGCFVVVGLSGVLSAFIRLGLTASTWVSPYGALLAAKTAGLILLGWVGREHRRRSVPPVLAGRPRAFLRLAGGEVVIMAAVIGLAVALGRTPYPAAAGAGAVPAHGIGHDTLSFEVLPWSPARVLTEWRPDAVVLTAVGLAVVAYLVGVRHLARRGQRWPRRRTASAMVGLATAMIALCGGLASYSTAMFSMQVAQLLVMATVVPLLLTLGMPLVLVREVRGGGDADATSTGPPLLAGRTARALGNPVNGLLLMVATIVGLYTTPLFEMSLRYFTLHLLVNVLAFAGGLVFFWSVMGVDELPERRGGTDRALVVIAFLLFLAGFGAVLVHGDGIYGTRWFTELGWAWVDPVVDQRRGGAVVWAVTVGVASVTLLVLGSQSRQPVDPGRLRTTT